MPAKIHYQKELNPAQLEAVESILGPHLVIAGAGSGKTRVLIYRVAYLVGRGVNPQDILLLTFTRKASQEMLNRATGVLDERCQKVSGGTFHSFANHILRRHSNAIGMPSHFSILDEDDSEKTLDLVRIKSGYPKMDKRFPKKNTLKDIISKAINKSHDLDTILYEEYPHFIQWKDAIENIRQEYQTYKRKMFLMDYDDLLINLKELLSSHSSIREKLSSQFQYIMVDEYQDTNKIQAEIIQLLSFHHQNIMVVGDDSQSIYSFRGANFRNIIEFPRMFPGTKVITLEENYRSIQPILDLTNDVIRCAEEKFAKTLFTNKEGEGTPVYVEVNYENSQSKYIIKKILEKLEEGVALNEMAVLFRSGWHSNDLEVELASQGIPFVKYGGQKFVESAHVKDLLAYLKVAHNICDEINLRRILTLLSGIGIKTAEKIIGQIIDSSRSGKWNEKSFGKSQELKELVSIYRNIDLNEMSPRDLLKVFKDFYLPLLVEHYDDYDKRLNDLESLERIALRYTSLQDFLADLALDPPEKTIVAADRKTGNVLNLSTIHSAKGLEWNTVFLIHLSEGYLPSYRSWNQPDAVEEERRLFYVATTRAKESLYLLRPRMGYSSQGSWDGGGMVYTRISRFLEEGEILSRYVQVENPSASNAGAW